jgi:hypothetical protein
LHEQHDNQYASQRQQDASSAQPQDTPGAENGEEALQGPGFDGLPFVPFLLLRVAPPGAPAPLDLAAPPQQLREQLGQLQAAGAGLFADSQGGLGQQRRRHEGEAAAALAFLRAPLASRHAVAVPQRAARAWLDADDEQQGGTGGAAWTAVGGPSTGATGGERSEAKLAHPDPQGQAVPGAAAAAAAAGGHRGPPEKSTASMATSLTGATSHGSLRTDAQSPDSQLVLRLRRLKLLQQQAAVLFA